MNELNDQLDLQAGRAFVRCIVAVLLGVEQEAHRMAPSLDFVLRDSVDFLLERFGFTREPNQQGPRSHVVATMVPSVVQRPL